MRYAINDISLLDKILVFSIDVDVLSCTSYDPRVQNWLSVRLEYTTTRSKGMILSLNPKMDNPRMLQFLLGTESITSFS